ncbi:MAG: carbohydrate porin [Candidatus Thiodiazotropha weberae]|nr:carbohydrate porin [Candidatus Thiodiazotropha lotti]MCG8010804.1 carbohydrate porin [Candidatus Thiodiazotropha lotti]MCG8020414.1 carbohydrate porin [Candidatus Thiodiazotropha lotti]MCW4207577.1 carbohydrate porin [Candidatus Thiodiazotropha lotti]MCW4210267.1 carbohydrate porin [Candidatus Thiodiazotropha lotti]
MLITQATPFRSLLSAVVLLCGPSALYADEKESELLLKEIRQMQQRIEQLEQQIQSDQVATEADESTVEAQMDEAEEAEASQISVNEGIKVGGAVRLQYSNERYREGNRDRGGDFDFDIFRLNLDGQMGGVLLSAEWRWFQYMNAVHHAWVGYQVDEDAQAQAGIQKVPFGVLPYNSHNFFFSSNYYVGLEDDYDAGVKYLHQEGPWDLRFGFYFNDEQGGVDGFVDNREDRYSYDVVGFRTPGEGTYAEPVNAVAENNTLNARVAYQLSPLEGVDLEVGVSGQYGLLHDGNDKAGNHSAYAVHLVGDYGPWNLQLQATSYEYDVDGGADLMAVGAYSFFDTIPAEADSYTANLAYSLPVAWGAITNLTFYNDFSLITNKSAGLDDTWMNVLGVAVSAGGLYTYIDFVTAENQPFIGGSMGTDSGESEQRLNINLGYYF